MIKIFPLTLFLVLSTELYGSNDFKSQKWYRLLPQRSQIKSVAQGDLNGDGLSDAVVFVKNESESKKPHALVGVFFKIEKVDTNAIA